MQTSFTLAQLADPDMAAAEKVLRTCVHCGFCTATCPTYVLLGDELDSPRGRIYLIKDMLENAPTRGPSAAHVRHLDRCLTCLSCMTTCPSGVHYMHLVDHARAHIEANYRRPPADRWLRRLLGWMLPRPTLFRLALLGAWFGRPFAGLIPDRPALARVKAMLRLAPAKLAAPSWSETPAVHKAAGRRAKRVALLSGCAQPALRPEINEAAIRLLTRLGVEVVVARGAGCCGAVNHHFGQHDAALARVKANVRAWEAEIRNGGLDAIIVTASGCGTTVKDYGWMLREDPEWAVPAARVSALAKDVSEVLLELDWPEPALPPDALPAIAYHSACSMQHGQKLKTQPQALLRRMGFTVREPAEGHLCCGSAGTYNLMQPEIAGQLKARKAGHLAATGARLVATGNIGCLTQLQGAEGLAVVHTVELLDWATGGPRPAEIAAG